MDIEYIKEIPALIIDKVFSDEINQAIKEEIVENEQMFEAAVVGGGLCENIRGNDVWYVETDAQFPNRSSSTILSAIDSLFQKNTEFSQAVVSTGVYPLTDLKDTNHGETQVSSYKCGDFYHWHIDTLGKKENIRLISSVYYVFNEDTVSGGELEISSSLMGASSIRDEGAKTWLIEPKNNRMVVFTAFVPHRAASVSVSGKEFKDRRFALVSWLGLR